MAFLNHSTKPVWIYLSLEQKNSLQTKFKSDPETFIAFFTFENEKLTKINYF